MKNSHQEKKVFKKVEVIMRNARRKNKIVSVIDGKLFVKKNNSGKDEESCYLKKLIK